jgi:8-oxo-dGTP pyrophosphatase MutT (NUDIX family)
VTAGAGGGAPVEGARPLVARVARALAARPGGRARVDDADPPPRRAAVALVLRPAPNASAAPAGAADALDLLFVQRAVYPGDPWSGHVAFPGGRAEPGDADLWHTAARETWEETGLDLRAEHPLGALDELYPRTPVLPPVVVRPYVAVLGPSAAAGPLTLSAELADAFWVPLAALAEPGVDAEREVAARDATLRVPSYAVAGRTVWGMTERILRQFLGVLGSG